MSTDAASLNLRLDTALIRRLKLHAVATERTASDIVADLIHAHIPDYTLTVSERPKGGKEC